MTTWLRGARCTDAEAMPQMEARPPAENRHGGAPRGERPASWDAPRLTSADRRASQARQRNKCACRRSAHPSLGGAKGKAKPGRRQRAAGTKNTALFDIVRLARRLACAPRLCIARAPPLVSRPSERQRAKTRDLGATRRIAPAQPYCASRRRRAGSRLSFRSASPLCTRPGHESAAVPPLRCNPSLRESLLRRRWTRGSSPRVPSENG